MTIAVLTDTHFDSFKAVLERRGRGRGQRSQGGRRRSCGRPGRRLGRRPPRTVGSAGRVRAAYRFYIAGNHEYYSGVGDWTAHMAVLGWEVLLNAHNGVVGERLVIAGVDDRPATVSPAMAPTSMPPTAGVPDLPIVLLAHQPHLIATSRDRVDLQISGHTHGGQMWPFHYLVRLREPVVWGCRDTGIAPRCGPVGATGCWGHPSGSSLRARSR